MPMISACKAHGAWLAGDMHEPIETAFRNRENRDQRFLVLIPETDHGERHDANRIHRALKFDLEIRIGIVGNDLGGDKAVLCLRSPAATETNQTLPGLSEP